MDEQLQAKIEEARKLGYSEEQIQEFLQQQPPAPAGAEPFQNRFEEAVGTTQYGAAEAAKYAALGGGGYYGLKKIAQALRGPAPAPGPVEPRPMTSTPGETFEKLRSGPRAFPPNAGPQFPSPTPVGQPSTVGTMAALGVLGAPYMAAGYEAAKIRSNPNAPGLETVPYAQMYRGEAPTMGAAGAANRRSAIAGQQYGGLTAEQQQLLEQDKIDQAIRRKAASKVLGQ